MFDRRKCLRREVDSVPSSLASPSSCRLTMRLSTSGRNLGHGQAAVNVVKRRKSVAKRVKGEALMLLYLFTE